ncbi:MAG: PAS domain S-box protein [bacterium]|nr:PAS domain S-box protein [bacterium]
MMNKAFLSKKSHIVALIVVLSLLTIFTSYLYYRYQTKNLRQSKQEELQAIAHLKLNQLMQWRQERSADAAVMSQRRFFLLRLEQWLRDRDNVKLSAAILEDLKMVQQAYNYESIVLSSVDSKLLLSSDDNLVHFDSLTNKKIKAAVDKGQITHSDFYYCNLENKIHYDVIIPLLNEKNQLIAVLILRTAPEEFIFPLMQSWPTPSKTAETLIVRQDRDSVLFLNQLRHLTDTALKLRFPLTAKEISAVQAILGYQGIWEGKDYLGKDVLADIRPVPNTPWFMISKIDKSELFHVLYVEIVYLIIFTILIIGTISAGLSFVYSYRQRNMYRRLWQSHQEFKTTLYSIGDAVITTDILGRIKYLNPVAEKLTGWREPSATGKALSKVFRIVNEETRGAVESPVERVLKEGLIVGLANHTVLISRDGKEIPIADSGAPIKDENGKIVGVVLVFRDQTEERKAQKALLESERKLSTLMSNLQGMVYSCLNDRDWTMKFVSQGSFGLTGYLPGELIDNKVISYNELIHPEDQQYVWDTVQAAQKTQSAYIIEYRIIARDKVVKWVWERGQGVFSADGELQGLEGFISDITERKRAEEALENLKNELEMKVKEQTKQLQKKITELQRFHDATIDREFRMKELRDEINELKKKTGEE